MDKIRGKMNLNPPAYKKVEKLKKVSYTFLIVLVLISSKFALVCIGDEKVVTSNVAVTGFKNATISTLVLLQTGKKFIYAFK